MTRFSSKVLPGLVFLGLAACGRAPTSTPSQAGSMVAARENLSRIVDRYWDEHMTLGNPLSAQSLADSLAVERRALAEVLAVPRAGLGADAGLTYDIFRRQRELAIEGFTYPAELMPVDPYALPGQFALAAAALGQYPFRDAKDVENWLLRIDGYVLWTRQAIANMREGMRRGYTSPKALMERTLPLLQALGEDSSANVFYLALRALPQTIQEPQRGRLISSLNGAIKDELLPAYRELHDFIQREYLPRARAGVALSALPLGPSWYAYRIKRATGAALSANEIHGIGKAEVERLRARLAALPAGQALTTAGAGELLNAYQSLKAQTLAAMPMLFSLMPRSDFEIRALASQSQWAPLTYQGTAMDGRAPAILYVNTGPAVAQPASFRVASFLQEALPGRHYQWALQQERADLPRFRRFGAEPALVEGWALYAASLGEELGVYRDDDAKRGALLGQLTCAAALVVDTGLHAKDWTPAQAADYLRTQLAVDAAEADLMTDRFVALPGDALACKMGELKIQALRSRAQQLLGARFDIREFHTQILKDGAMPLDILDAKMQLWMDALR